MKRSTREGGANKPIVFSRRPLEAATISREYNLITTLHKLYNQMSY